MPEHVLMSGIEIITDGGRRRRWTAAEKLRIVRERGTAQQSTRAESCAVQRATRHHQMPRSVRAVACHLVRPERVSARKSTCG
ncbi:hypothetical protein FHD67_12965 [Paracoccus haeundaensis]|jgi:transposase-like protein|uniref:Transposase n=1 Tax=Paracoccus haeundaensis TaxID=225362 RepID=A0A5C4R479_9RHOB|nr:hypothetical protein FHD67_12965 [Paracoccus haeundaensis]